MIRVRGILAALALSLGVSAQAQLPPGFQLPSLWYNPALVMDPGVQKELKLSPGALNKIQGVIMNEGMKVFPALGSLMGGQGGKAPTQAEAARVMPGITAGFAKMQKACVDNMTGPQLERLHQITLQSFGPKSLLDPKIGSQVGMSAAQENKLKSEMTKIGEAQRAEAQKVFMGRMQNPQAAAAMMAATRKRTEALLNSVLTPKQLAKWKALQGKPYHLTGMAAMMGGG